MTWKPIAEITEAIRDGADARLMLRAPELFHPDCNPDGVAPGYFQEGCEAAGEPGRYYAAGYDTSNDTWESIEVTPTHFLVVDAPQGVPAFTDAEVDAAYAAGLDRYVGRMRAFQEPAFAYQAGVEDQKAGRT